MDKYVVPVSVDEIVVLIFEGMGNIKRNEGVSTEEALEAFKANDGDAIINDVYRAANNILEYFAKCFDNPHKIQ